MARKRKQSPSAPAPRKTQPADLSVLKRISVHDRPCLVAVSRLAKLPEAGAGVGEFLAGLPDFLGVRQLRQLAGAVVAARRADLPVIVGMGAHVLKVGCGPIVVDLIRRGLVTHVALNGAGAIHDYELASTGATSEDVGASLHEGLFGMVTETAQALAEAANRGASSGCGLGEAMGRLILERGCPHAGVSVLAAAAEHARAGTVHVAIGCDTVHMHAEADGAAIGQASHIDFRIFCQAVAEMDHRPGADRPDAPGGVYLNIGSAVLLPEVFLKAFSVARNLGANLDTITTANLDMQQHYRPGVNVVKRPARAGRGVTLTGQHEILLPLLRMAILHAAEG